ncbi:MAG: hypothetical protein J6252_06465 [Clostridia bacterium]|nr:hypothetical protein [Clostridia bacterium]
MKYVINRAKTADFSLANVADISEYRWEKGYAPKAEARLLYISGRGFALQMKAYENDPKAVFCSYNDPVYKDSCLEFFVSFNKNSKKYMNFEMNSRGAFLAAVRTDRKNKTPIHELAELPEVKPVKGDGWWGVEAFFTLGFIKQTFGVSRFCRGDVIKGNFYKCGDETPQPHYGMWSPVCTETPDFHRPEYFGDLIIGE